MKFLETTEEKKSFAITSAIFAVLLLIVLFFGMTYMDPPPENGIAINFGTSDVGQGEIQPTEPIKSAPTPTVSEPVTSNEENTLTQDDDSPVVVTPKKDNTKPKTETPKETPKPKVETPKPSSSTTNALDALINGPKSDGNTTGGHGDDGLPGDKGDPNRSIYANSFYGGGSGNGTGGGRGYGLNGRNLAKKGEKVQQCGNETGKVIVQITVNRSGDVIKTQYVKGTTNTTPCVLDAAYRTARNYKWKADSNAPDTQIGWIEVNFTVGE
ncbi:energy transducer TonB [Flavobacterium haoranii]|uniref:Outer membrane transport energization protein TonB n=2 Tax=Flavobacterium haoranii TaxID=683124 RepID=A0A1M6JCX2_9FLAO|nr:energy transducer TonB [Flavobacterium haoranii]SHJ44596.1 outer membrane transport energization protein TonB [Flavobacterium haoranii]